MIKFDFVTDTQSRVSVFLQNFTGNIENFRNFYRTC